jgi:hypothetical protein
MQTLTLAEIKRVNSELWKVEHDPMKSRMADDANRETAFEDMAAETQKRVSIPSVARICRIGPRTGRGGLRASLSFTWFEPTLRFPCKLAPCRARE